MGNALRASGLPQMGGGWIQLEQGLDRADHIRETWTSGHPWPGRPGSRQEPTRGAGLRPAGAPWSRWQGMNACAGAAGDAGGQPPARSIAHTCGGPSSLEPQPAGTSLRNAAKHGIDVAHPSRPGLSVRCAVQHNLDPGSAMSQASSGCFAEACHQSIALLSSAAASHRLGQVFSRVSEVGWAGLGRWTIR